MFEQLFNVPQAMRSRPQWIVWRYEQREDGKPTKVPYDPKTGRKASVTDAGTWATFDATGMALQSGRWAGAGYVFTKADPHCGIDFDVPEGGQPSEAQVFAVNKLNSYAELSPSGRGLHVIVEASVPLGRNNRDLGIELYSEGRFFTVTGNTINNAPIAERNAMVNELWSELGGVFSDDLAAPYEIQNPTNITDEDLIRNIRASGRNKAYFDWAASFDWSEAYRSVIGAACLFSSDEDQVRRVILQSPLATQAPAHGRETRLKRIARLWAKEYGYAARVGDLERADNAYRIWSRNFFPGGSRELFAEVMAAAEASAQAILSAYSARNLQEIQEAAARHTTARVGIADATKLPVPLKAAGMVTVADLDRPAPPGMFSELGLEVMARCRNPNDIMAAWAIIGLISGAAGRSYVTEDGLGINNFMVLSAGTNTGKSQHWSALSSIVKQSAPDFNSRIMGGDAASPQIIAKEGQNMPSMVLRLPDAGSWLKGVVEAKTSIQLAMRSALLNIYESANVNGQWHIPKSIRAKDDKNETIDEFCMSLVLDTTPQYVGDFNLTEFTDGLMSRFIIIYGPEVVSPLRAPKPDHAPVPDHIKHQMASIMRIAAGVVRPTTVGKMAPDALGLSQRVVIANGPGVTEYSWALELEINDKIAAIQRGDYPQHYIAASRVILNAKRIAACIAVIERPESPVVTREIYDWALSFVLRSASTIIRMFDEGSMGSDESKQEAAIVDFIVRQVKRHPEAPYVTLRDIGQNVDRLQCFASAKIGARQTRQKLIADMLERGVLIKSQIQTASKPKTVITLA